jgi:S1-C subfamily serine protease
MRLGNTGDVREGELYAFTGFPILNALGLHPVTHQGIVSAISPIVIPVSSSKHLKRDVLKKLSKPFDVFQLDATAYPGNSGSPLYEIDTGRVVGVINSVYVKKTKEMAITSPSGISYAIPVGFVRDMLKAAGLKF